MKRIPFSPTLLPLTIEYDEEIQRQLSVLDRSLGRFDGLLSVLPNQDLLIAPLTRKEAVNSAQIEGSESTLSDALLFDAGEAGLEKRDDLQEIFNYRHALNESEEKLRGGYPFDLWLLRGLHGILLGGSVRGGDKTPGGFRTHQNWIGPPGALMNNASYVPPPPEKIPELMDNWLIYWRDNSPPPLVQAAILHAQFEIIHPFMDGNGRIGRLLMPLFLSEKKVLARPVFYLSERLFARRDEYQHLLQGLNTHPGKWREWISFFLNTCTEQVEANIKVCHAMLNLHKELTAQALQIMSSHYTPALMNAIFEKPAFKIGDLRFADKRPSNLTLMTMIKKLVAQKMLTQERAGRRGKPAIFMLPILIKTIEGRS